MGRLPNSGIRPKKNRSCIDDMRKRHRDADCKYRSKVQYLYFKIKSLLRKKSAKDGLLDNALGFIQDLENEIYETSGSNLMESCKKEFLNFLVLEESIWKKEKDVTKWWTEVEYLLSKDYPMDLRIHKNMDSIVEEDFQHCKSSKEPYQTKGLISLKNLNKNGPSCSCCVNEHMCMLPSSNEEFLNLSRINKNGFSNSSWNIPEVSNVRPFSSNKDKRNSADGETQSDDSTNSNSNDIFNSAVPLGVSCIPVPVRSNSMINTLEYSQQAQSSFLYL